MAEFELAPDAPGGFYPDDAYSLELTYDFDANDKPVYAYRKTTESFFSTADSAVTSWSAFLPVEEFRNILDMHIRTNCMVVLRTDEDKDLFWSLQKDALTTKQDRKTYYFELRYRNGPYKYTRQTYPGNTCKEISFKAKFNSANPGDRLHAFNFNVKYKARDGSMQSDIIDPDIRNPGDDP